MYSVEPSTLSLLQSAAAAVTAAVVCCCLLLLLPPLLLSPAAHSVTATTVTTLARHQNSHCPRPVHALSARCLSVSQRDSQRASSAALLLLQLVVSVKPGPSHSRLSMPESRSSPWRLFFRQGRDKYARYCYCLSCGQALLSNRSSNLGTHVNRCRGTAAVSPPALVTGHAPDSAAAAAATSASSDRENQALAALRLAALPTASSHSCRGASGCVPSSSSSSSSPSSSSLQPPGSSSARWPSPSPLPLVQDDCGAEHDPDYGSEADARTASALDQSSWSSSSSSSSPSPSFSAAPRRRQPESATEHQRYIAALHSISIPARELPVQYGCTDSINTAAEAPAPASSPVAAAAADAQPAAAAATAEALQSRPSSVQRSRSGR